MWRPEIAKKSLSWFMTNVAPLSVHTSRVVINMLSTHRQMPTRPPQKVIELQRNPERKKEGGKRVCLANSGHWPKSTPFVDRIAHQKKKA